jgi:hypothetical protein
MTCTVGDGDCVDTCASSPCTTHGDVDAVCTSSGATFSCTCSDGWEVLFASADDLSCIESATRVQESIALEGGVSADEFAAGILAALPAATGDSPAPVIVVDSYIAVADSAIALPGTADEFIEGSTKLAALSYGLQQASCGDADLEVCRAEISSISRRRRLLQQDGESRRRLQTIDVDFSVTSTVDVSDAVQPDAFSTAFVAAVTDQPGGALSDVSTDDLSVEEPVVTTTIEYTVVMPDAASAEAAATTLADDSSVATGVATAVPGAVITVSAEQPPPPPPPPPPPTPPVTPSSSVAVEAPPSTAAEDDDGGGAGVIVLLIILVVGGGVGAAGFFFKQQSDASKANDDIGEDTQAFSNPMVEAEEEEAEEEEEEEEEEVEEVEEVQDGEGSVIDSVMGRASKKSSTAV